MRPWNFLLISTVLVIVVCVCEKQSECPYAESLYKYIHTHINVCLYTQVLYTNESAVQCVLIICLYEVSLTECV